MLQAPNQVQLQQTLDDDSSEHNSKVTTGSERKRRIITQIALLDEDPRVEFCLKANGCIFNGTAKNKI